jgi:hypothetical protein
VTGRFLHLLPVKFLKTTVIKATNRTLSDPLTAWQELLQFMEHLLFFEGTRNQGDPRSVIWANDTSDLIVGAAAPNCLLSYKSRERFESTLIHLRFTTTESLPLEQPFHPVNELIGTFNENHQLGWDMQQARINQLFKQK